MAKTGIVTHAMARTVESEIMGAGSQCFLFLDFGHHTYWSRKLTRGLACGDRIDRQ
jgi:hypothetical protein